MLALSCAKQQQAAAPQTALRDRRAEEIIALHTQIRDWRREAGWSVVPDPKWWGVEGGPWSRPKNLTTEECKDICDIAEAICSNADSICKIADEMPGDTWAKTKCDSAKASCNEARDRCVNCEK
jgi:hypothetical protein